MHGLQAKERRHQCRQTLMTGELFVLYSLYISVPKRFVDFSAVSLLSLPPNCWYEQQTQLECDRFFCDQYSLGLCLSGNGCGATVMKVRRKVCYVPRVTWKYAYLITYLFRLTRLMQICVIPLSNLRLHGVYNA